MNKKGLAIIILIVTIIVSVSYYFIFVKKHQPIAEQFTTTPLTTETARGYIKNVYEKNSKRYLDIDYIQMVSGFAAVKAKVENGDDCLPHPVETTGALLKELEQYSDIDVYGVTFADTKFGNCVPPSGQYIYNKDLQIRTLEISNDVQILRSPAFSTRSMSYQEFRKIFTSKDTQHYNNPFEIEVVNGLILTITELFVS